MSRDDWIELSPPEYLLYLPFTAFPNFSLKEYGTQGTCLTQKPKKSQVFKKKSQKSKRLDNISWNLVTQFFAQHSGKNVEGYLLDEVTSGILQCVWHAQKGKFLIKAEYPGIPAHFKLFSVDDFRSASYYWEEFTYLYYYHYKNTSEQEARKRANDHRRIMKVAYRFFDHKCAPKNRSTHTLVKTKYFNNLCDPLRHLDL
jgi:hypothetical protein